MLARQGSDTILQKVGRNSLQSYRNGKSWFIQLRQVCDLYNLPDPLLVLQSPPSKYSWKKECKAKVMLFWEDKLRLDAKSLPSLSYFKPEYMSLSTVHPLWSLAESAYEVRKAATVACMLSGRYVTDYRSRHWEKSNPSGYCQLCMMTGFPQTPGTLTHLLIGCPALSDVRLKMISLWRDYILDKPTLFPLVNHHTVYSDQSGEELHMLFLLDPSSCPTVILSVQNHGQGILSDLMYLTRTWCHSHHSKRRNLLKLYNVI